jgi:hypothetical protein
MISDVLSKFIFKNKFLKTFLNIEIGKIVIYLYLSQILFLIFSNFFIILINSTKL